MQIKKYLATNVRDALSQIKLELGPEALIISTKNLKKGKNDPYGILSTDMVEVMAAVETDTHHAQKPIFEKPSTPQAFAAAQSSTQVFTQPHTPRSDLSLEFIQTEITALKKMIEKGFSQHQSQPLWSNIYHQIRYMGVEEDITAALLKTISEDDSSIFTEGELSIKNYLKELLHHLINTSGPINLNGNSPKIVALVGPSGAGKTTTIAKLAGILALKKRKKIALISLDTGRIGGTEQLASYAKIMGIPMNTARTHNELMRHIDSFKNTHCVFIDTAGYNHKDTIQMEKLKKFLSSTLYIEKHLVVSATTHSKELLTITKNFQLIGIDRLLFTKLDEATQFGTIFNHMIYTNLSLSYFTAGQHVPDDLEVATPQRLSELIINSTKA
ncbi:MAG: flagellar biosynthesis protein FlhF [bacterium]